MGESAFVFLQRDEGRIGRGRTGEQRRTTAGVHAERAEPTRLLF